MKEQQVFNDWTIRECIGKGAFGSVYHITREDFGREYEAALKIIEIPKEQAEVDVIRNEGLEEESITEYFKDIVEELVDEFALMSKLKGNSNIVSYEYHSVVPKEDSFGWNIYIRMELLKPFTSYIKEHTLTVRDVIKLGIDMCHALEVCQKYNIIHRDIKPENIFVSNIGDFKLGDFGIARQLEKTSSGLSKKGTYTYMAPEVYKGLPYNSTVDIYSLGIVLYRFLNNNRAPFLPAAPAVIHFSDREKANVMRMSGEKLPNPCNATGRLAEIVLKACAYDPKERYESAYEMRQALQSVMYSEEEGKEIYPQGDQLENENVEYISSDSTVSKRKKENSETKEMFSSSRTDDEAVEKIEKEEGTIFLFEEATEIKQKNTEEVDSKEIENTEEKEIKQEDKIKENNQEKEKEIAAQEGNSIEKNTTWKKIIAAGIAVCAVIGIAIGILNKNKENAVVVENLNKEVENAGVENNEAENNKENQEVAVNEETEQETKELSKEELKALEEKGFIIKDGVLEKYTGSDETVVIPDGIWKIGEEAFINSKTLLNAEIPSGVTEIGEKAFGWCSNLSSIEIPSSVSKIGYWAFRGCHKLNNVEIPFGVTEIEESVFDGCSNLSSIEIPTSVTKIGEGAFFWCSNLSSIEIPTSVTKIEGYAFSLCSNLSSIEIPTSITKIGEGVFSGCSNLSSIEIPTSVTKIGEEAFSGCSNLSSIEIPTSVTEIGEGAFNDCSNLSSIEIPASVTKIGKGTFEECRNLSSIEIPTNVTEIGEGAFRKCSKLRSIKIPTNVTEIGAYTFFNCKNLSSIEIPASVTKIGECAFEYCRNLSSIEIPESVIEIGANAFSGCYKLKNVGIPSGMTKISDGTFQVCSNLNNIRIPTRVTEIGNKAFRFCSKLRSIEIPTSVTKIGKTAFKGVSDDCIIYCSKKSYAFKYAKKYGFSYSIIKK